MAIQEEEIEKVAFDLLKQSKSFGVFPTPVNQIVTYSELETHESNDLVALSKNYLGRASETLKKAVRKVKGALDRKEKIIYLDPSLHISSKRFVKLHEVGHETIPWQKAYYDYLEDDELTISLEPNDEFEAEANFFASASLFQLDRFEEESNKLSLELFSAIELARKFGGSIHASLRRYVEKSSKRCSLIVLKNPDINSMSCKVRNYFQSSSFTKEFGRLSWSSSLGFNYSFVQDYVLNQRKPNRNGSFSIKLNGNEKHIFNYHYFSNSYNGFVLILPIGEVQPSRTKIILKQ